MDHRKDDDRKDDRTVRSILKSLQIFRRITGAMPLWLITVCAIAGALLIGSIFVAAAGINPLTAYAAMFKGAFSTPVRFGITVSKTATLLLAGLGVGLAFRCGLINIGGDGQIYMGALFSVLIAVNLHGIPLPLHILLCFIGGFVGGGLCGMIPGILKAFLNLNEIITTIMFNYIAKWFVGFLVNGAIKDPEGTYPWTVEVPASARLPVLDRASLVNIGIIIAVAAAVVVYFLLFKTTFGYSLRASGANSEGAEFAGIGVKKSIVLSMVVSGGLAGMAGTVELLGSQLRLSDFFSPGYGFDAIAVSCLAGSHPLGTIVSSFFFGALGAGAQSLQRTLPIPYSVAQIIQGLILLFIIIGGSSKIRMLIRRKKRTAARGKAGIGV